MKNEIIDYFLRLHSSDYAFFTDMCARISNEILWKEPSEGVPIGNILCHVAEMERFWIDWGLCGEEFNRDRQIEFDRRNDLTPAELHVRLEKRRDETVKRINNLSDKQWTEERTFHGDPFTGQGILIWHSRHIGLHRGHVQALERLL